MHATTVHIAESQTDFDFGRELIVEYSKLLGEDFCLLGFEEELATLDKMYAQPGGVLLLASAENAPVGCVAYRSYSDGVCEMKRLYVRPVARGQHLGRRLVDDIVVHARSAGYRRIILDTLPKLHAAIALYRSLGFVQTPPYYNNPIPGVVFLALDL